MLPAAEVGKRDPDRMRLRLARERQGEHDVAAICRIARLKIPLALLTPAKADRTLRNDYAAILFQGDGLPIGIVLFSERVGKI